jgi:phosphatidylinositol alpha-1,6-mannosyltransferase
MTTARPLLVTNDFLPDVGGIQQYVSQIAARLPGVGVFAPANEAADDTGLGYPVWRGPQPYLWPTAAVRRALLAAVEAHRATVAVFMAPAPLTPLGPALDVPWAACTHGAELVVPARIPGLRRVYARVLRRAHRLYAVSAYTADVLRELVGARGPEVALLRNGVDLDRFHPDVDPTAVRARHHLGSAPTIVAVGRLVPRKGQDALIAALPQIRAAVPGTCLLLVGTGRDLPRLQRLTHRHRVEGVVFAGRVAWADLPAYHRAGSVFAHPNRSRWGGLEQEGFGVVFLEAQACGVPVVAGRSGGSPEALVDGHSGVLVDGRDRQAVAGALIALLTDAQRRRAMGAAARAWVERSWSWDTIVDGFARELSDLSAHIQQVIPRPPAA